MSIIDRKYFCEKGHRLLWRVVVHFSHKPLSQLGLWSRFFTLSFDTNFGFKYSWYIMNIYFPVNKTQYYSEILINCRHGRTNELFIWQIGTLGVNKYQKCLSNYTIVILNIFVFCAKKYNQIKSKMLWLSSIVMNGLQITFGFNILHRYKHEKNCKQYHRPSPTYSVNYL